MAGVLNLLPAAVPPADEVVFENERLVMSYLLSGLHTAFVVFAIKDELIWAALLCLRLQGAEKLNQVTQARWRPGQPAPPFPLGGFPGLDPISAPGSRSWVYAISRAKQMLAKAKKIEKNCNLVGRLIPFRGYISSQLLCCEGFYRTGDSVALAAGIHRFHGVVVGRLRREVVQVHAEHCR